MIPLSNRFSISTPEFKIPSWLYNESGSSTAYIVISIIAAVLCIGILFWLSFGKDKNSKNATKTVAYAGIMLALSMVLSMIRLWRMPQGGTITPASLLPIALFAYMFGAKKGVLVGFAFGLLQALADGYIVHPVQFLLDYPIAFATIGLVGLNLFKKLPKTWSLPVAIIFGVLLRYLVHSLGGMVFFAEYAESQTFLAIFVYSFGYNTFCLIDGAICVALSFAFSTNKSLVRLIENANA